MENVNKRERKARASLIIFVKPKNARKAALIANSCEKAPVISSIWKSLVYKTGVRGSDRSLALPG